MKDTIIKNSLRKYVDILPNGVFISSWGLIALEQDRINEAIIHFRKSVEVRRRLFPKRLARKHYRVDLATRPYTRGLRNLLLSLNRSGKYLEAMEICEKLERGVEIPI